MLLVGTFTITTTGNDAADVHPFALTALTVYDPEAVTVILCVVAPLLQRYPSAGLAVSTTLPPWQNVVVPSLIVIVGAAGD